MCLSPVTSDNGILPLPPLHPQGQVLRPVRLFREMGLKISKLVRLDTSHQTLMGYGAASTQGGGQTWNSGFSYENNAPIVRPCFFFIWPIIKKQGGFFSRPFFAHVLFFSAHVSAFPTYDSRAAIWLSFWCSTRPSADTGTN